MSVFVTYTAHDKREDLNIQAKVHDMAGPTLVTTATMVHLFGGTYYYEVDTDVDGPTNYIVNKTVYTDNTFTTVHDDYTPSDDVIAAGFSSAPTSAEIADAVWSTGVSGYTDLTTFGGFIRSLLTVGKFLGFK